MPAEAVFQRGGLTGVFVGAAAAQGGRPSPACSDRTRRRRRRRIEVRAGLDAGERVVLAPGDLLDGTLVVPADGRRSRRGRARRDRGGAAVKHAGLAGRIARTFLDSKLTPLLILGSLASGALALLATPREEEPQIRVPMET